MFLNRKFGRANFLVTIELESTALVTSALAMVLSLAACSGGVPNEEDILASAENMEKPLPGLYRSTSTLIRFDLPDANPQEADRMRGLMEVLEPQETTICLTQEQSDEGFVALLRDIQQDNCEVESFEAGSTSFRAELRCPGTGGSASHVIMAGKGTAESSRMELEVEQTGPSIPGGQLDMQFVVENQRIDDC